MSAAAYPVTRNALLLSAALVCLSGMIQLVVAVATTTLVVVTGIEGILGLGPAIFLTTAALAALPAGGAPRYSPDGTGWCVVRHGSFPHPVLNIFQ